MAYGKVARRGGGFGLLTSGAIAVVLVGGLASVGPDASAGASTQDATVSSFRAVPASLGSSGGQVKLVARVTGATSCKFTSKPKYAGLPLTVACSNGTVTTTVTVPANVATTTVQDHFALVVTSHGGARLVAKTEVSLAPGPAATGIVSVSSNYDSSCALLSTGGVDCWGDNPYGELGNGTVAGPDGQDGYDTPEAVTGITNAISVSSDGYGSYCAVLSTGAVDCWGDNQYGELGNGTVGGPDGEDGYDTPQAVTGITNATSVSTTDGGVGYCTVLSTGGGECWGYNGSGQVGNGTTSGPDGEYGYDTPQPVTGLTNAVSVSSYTYGNCAVLSSGGVDCWGNNSWGQVGNGTLGGPEDVGYDTPQTVAGLADAVSVTNDGYGSYCALLSTGAVDCWGENVYGELGNGTTDGPDGNYGYDTAQAVTGLTTAVSVASDGYGSYCALLSTGGVDCWGENQYGQVGNGTTDGPDGEYGYDTPQAVTGLTTAVSVPSAGYGSYCALLSTGGIDCWGYNDYGQVGNGTTDGPDGEYGYDTTQEVGHLTRAISMSGSNDNSCAVLSTGAAKCWGDNQYGELGNGTTGGPDGAYGYDTPHSVSAA